MLSRLIIALTALLFVSDGLFAVPLSNTPLGRLREGSTVVIRKTIDLNGGTVEIPRNCTLVLKKRGKIGNGTLRGMETVVKITDKRVHFLKSLTMEGIWCSEVAYSEWFDAKPDCKLSSEEKLLSGTDNFRALQNLLLFNNVAIKKGCYYLKGNLRTNRSNQLIDGCNATIKGVFVNRYAGVLSINADSVKLCNLTIIGVRDESKEKTQWAHGVVVERAANIILENVTCRKCRGDGFNITETNLPGGLIWPEGITMINCRAEDNYRNGLSITGGHLIKVLNSSFISTRGQDPEAGIDVEPNVYQTYNTIKTSECSDIIISNCFFSDNSKTGLVMQAPVDCERIKSFPVRNIIVEDCSFYRNSISFWRLSNIVLRDCDILTEGGCHGIVFQDAEQRNITLQGVTILNGVNDEPERIGIFVCPGHRRNHLRFEDIRIAGPFKYCVFIPSDDKYKNTITDVVFENVSVSNGWHNFFVGNMVKDATYKDIKSSNRGMSINGKKYRDYDWGWSIHKHNE